MSANLCTNGDFETDTTGWTASVCTFASSTDQAQKGTKSGKMIATGNGQSFVNIPFNIAGTGSLFGLGMYARCWVFATGATIGRSFTTQINSGATGLGNVASSHTTITLLAGWNKFISAVAPNLYPDAFAPTFYVVNTAGATSDIAYVDFVEFGVTNELLGAVPI